MRDNEEPIFIDPDEDPEGMKDLLRMIQRQLFVEIIIPVDMTRLPSEIGASGWVVSHSLE